MVITLLSFGLGHAHHSDAGIDVESVVAFEGTVSGNAFRLVGLQPKQKGLRLGVGRMKLTGDRYPDASFEFSVADSMSIRTNPLGTVFVTQR